MFFSISKTSYGFDNGGFVVVDAESRTIYASDVFGSLYEIRNDSATKILDFADMQLDDDCSKGLINGTIYRGELHIVGCFKKLQEIPDTAFVAKWSHGKWEGISHAQADARIASAQVFQGKLYLAGTFSSLGELPETSGIVAWDGAAFSSVASGISGFVSRMCSDGHFLAVSGEFTLRDQPEAKNLAIFNGHSWQTNGVTLPEAPYDLFCHSGGDIYAAGSFDPPARLLRDTQWLSLELPVDHSAWWDVRRILVDGSEVYAAGHGLLSGSTSLAVKQGSQWISLAGAGVVNLNILNGKILAAGGFFVNGEYSALGEYDPLTKVWRRLL